MCEEINNEKEYKLLISQGIDDENQYKFFIERLSSKKEFNWSEIKPEDYKDIEEETFRNIDMTIILAGLYKKNKELIENLVEKSEENNIPFILIKPYGMELVPENLERKAAASVGWNADCIIDAIKTITGGDDWKSLCQSIESQSKN